MKTILVPTDFSPYSSNAISAGSAIARVVGGQLILVHNVQTLLTRWESLSETEQRKYPEVLSRGEDALKKFQQLTGDDYLKNLRVQKLVTYGVTSDEIIRKAKQYDADIIVMGSHGNVEKERDFIASNIQQVIREAACPVLAVKRQMIDPKWTKLVLPDTFDFDISKPFEKIKKVAQAIGSTIQLLYINTPETFKSTDTINKRMRAFQLRYPEIKFETAIYNHTDIEKGILEFIKMEKPDYIAMITFDHKNQPKYFVGVTDGVVYHSNIPVMTVAVNSAEVEDSVKQDIANTL